jgi:hypothetical protein
LCLILSSHSERHVLSSRVYQTLTSRTYV